MKLEKHSANERAPDVVERPAAEPVPPAASETRSPLSEKTLAEQAAGRLALKTAPPAPEPPEAQTVTIRSGARGESSGRS